MGTLTSQYKNTAAAVLKAMYTHMSPKFRHAVLNSLDTPSRKVSVLDIGQNPQLAVASGLVTYPPRSWMYASIYSWHVWLLGGLKCSSSTDSQTTLVPDTAVESIADTRYVNGETRYMKIQKPGRA